MPEFILLLFMLKEKEMIIKISPNETLEDIIMKAKKEYYNLKNKIE